jgi:hypothetical protein
VQGVIEDWQVVKDTAKKYRWYALAFGLFVVLLVYGPWSR